MLKDTQIHILADSDEQEVVQQLQVTLYLLTLFSLQILVNIWIIKLLVVYCKSRILCIFESKYQFYLEQPSC